MKAFYETRMEMLFAGSMTHYPFPLHVHEHVEIVVVHTGECRMLIDGKPWVLGPGDAAVAFPLVPHSYESLSPDIDGFVVIFPEDTIQEFSSVFHTMLPAEPFLRAARAESETCLAIDRLMQSADADRMPMRLAWLHVLLASLLQRMRLEPAGTNNERSLSYRVVKYVNDHAFERISLATAAHGLGISESHLSHLFSQQLQVNFRRFVNAIRIDRAKSLMMDPHMTLTGVCYNCGYENMRTFRRAFIHETGMLPTAFLQELRSGNIVFPARPEENAAEA